MWLRLSILIFAFTGGRESMSVVSGDAIFLGGLLARIISVNADCVIPVRVNVALVTVAKRCGAKG